MKLTCKRINELIKDERLASVEYKRLGFKRLSSDEKQHQRFLEKIKKHKCK